MNTLLIQPGEHPTPVTISGTLKSMQELVCGPIEVIYPFKDPVALVCNEEGKLNHLTPNRALGHPETGEIYDVVFGPFFLCSAPTDSDRFESLSQEQIKTYTEMFRNSRKISSISIVLEVL